MARTKRAPWDYRETHTPEQMRESDLQGKISDILNRLEWGYGIDRISKIYKSWGDISWDEKYKKVRQLENELDCEGK